MEEKLTNPETDVRAQAAKQIELLTKKNKDGSSWFFWIAGLSLINSAVILSGSEWSFLIGLGLTQLIDGISIGIAQEVGAQGITMISVVAFALDAIVAGSFVLWGVLARRNYRWAYITGMILYALDGLIFLTVQDFPSFGFHIFALYCIFNGFKACGQLKTLSSLLSNAEVQSNQASI